MMNRMGYLLVVFLLTLGCWLISPPVIRAQPLTHIVQKGDTLWDICEKYYGDANLWPKLWQMNPFVTNPHLLNAGDVITLLEEVPIKKMKAPVEEKEIPEPTPIGRGINVERGIDVSGISIIKSLGFLSLKKFKPLGTILVADSNKTILAKRDIIYVNFVEKKDINPGDEFTISNSSPRLKHPLTDKPLGYTISFKGRFVIKDYIKKNIYKAEIVETYREVHVGDMAIPYEPISPCVQPTSFGKKMIENIVAVKDQLDLIGPSSIVYLNRGFLQGIRRGVVFEIVKKRVIPDPDIKLVTVFSRFKKMELPDLVIGRLIILETRPDTATALVLSAKEEFQNGSYIKALSWVETPEFITMIPPCSLE